MTTRVDTMPGDAYPLKVPHTSQVFLCPNCECELEYAGSQPTNGSGTEMNDYFRCPAGCGTFEHERRSHRLRWLDTSI